MRSWTSLNCVCVLRPFDFCYVNREYIRLSLWLGRYVLHDDKTNANEYTSSEDIEKCMIIFLVLKCFFGAFAANLWAWAKVKYLTLLPLHSLDLSPSFQTSIFLSVLHSTPQFSKIRKKWNTQRSSRKRRIPIYWSLARINPIRTSLWFIIVRRLLYKFTRFCLYFSFILHWRGKYTAEMKQKVSKS